MQKLSSWGPGAFLWSSSGPGRLARVSSCAPFTPLDTCDKQSSTLGGAGDGDETYVHAKHAGL